MVQRTFETYLGNAYVLPDSSVFMFQKINNNIWEIWNGFRTSELDSMRVFKVGLASPNHLILNDVSVNERRNFRGTTLRTNTVVRE